MTDEDGIRTNDCLSSLWVTIFLFSIRLDMNIHHGDVIMCTRMLKQYVILKIIICMIHYRPNCMSDYLCIYISMYLCYIISISIIEVFDKIIVVS